MATYTKVKLSGSTDGKGIKVAATATPGTTLHVASATGTLDEVWAWVTNLDTVDRNLTIEFGGVTDPDNLLVKALVIPAKSPPIPIITGQILTNGLTIGAFADSANKLVVTGYVNKIT